MLDKGQIKDWDGEPEADGKPPAALSGRDRHDIAQAMLGSREAIPTGERVQLTAEEVAARKKRSRWIALALIAFVILLFVLTITKVGGNVASWGTAFE